VCITSQWLASGAFTYLELFPTKAPTKMKFSTQHEIERWKSFPRKRSFTFLLVANLIDLCLTSYAILAGIAEEINPLMSVIIDTGVIYFAIVKLTVMQLALFVAYSRWLRTNTVPINRFWPVIVCVYGFVILWNTIMIILGHLFPEPHTAFPS